MRPLLLLLTTSTVAAIAISAQAEPASSNWVFRRGYYTHSPKTGLRVAQYAPLPAVAALPDVSPIRSGYRRSRVTMRGPDGTVDDSYQVESWGNGRGGIDAEWERFHDAWRSSILAGGTRSGPYSGGYGGYGGYGPLNPGYGPPGYGVPGYGTPGYGTPGYGTPGYGYGPRPLPYGYGYGQGAGYGSGGYGPNAGNGGYRPDDGHGPTEDGPDGPARFRHDRSGGSDPAGHGVAPGY